MFWVVALLILIFLAFGAGGVRVVLKVGAALLVLGVVLVAGYISNQSAEREAAKKRMGPSEVQFDDLRLDIAQSGKLTGTVRNRSREYTLQNVELEVTLRDCVQKSCDVVGQESSSLLLDVPPGQIRAVDQYVFFSNLPPRRGDYRWDYIIKSVEAR